MKKNKISKWASLLLSLSLLTSISTSPALAAGNDTVIHYPDTSIQANLPAEKPSAGEDYYLSVNYDDLKEMTLPAGHATYQTLNVLQDQADEITKKLLAGDSFEDPTYEAASTLYKEYLNTEKRNANGWKSIVPYIEKLEKVQSMAELLELTNTDPVYHCIDSILPISVSSDLADSNLNVAWLSPPGLFLEDSAEYENPSELGELYKKANDTYFMKLLTRYGYSETDAQTMIDAAFAWESTEAQYILPLEVSYQPDYYSIIYNPYKKADLIELAGTFPIEDHLESYGVSDQDVFIVTQPEWIRNLSAICTDEHLEEIRAYMIIECLDVAATYSDEEAYEIHNDWENEKNGSSGMEDIQQQAYELTKGFFPEVVGDLYAKNTFTEEERKDTEAIVYAVKDSLRNRLAQADWMSEETRNIAIDKLDTMKVYMGYADEFYLDYSKFAVSSEADLLTNIFNISIEIQKQRLSNAGQPTNKKTWNYTMAANVVNACYIPDSNCICFPAAILKAPVYDNNASIASNYGGLGLVAGHELTHAFDTTGSQFDKDGNMVNWWQDADLEAFTALTNKVAERYHAYATVDNERVKGDLTIGETVADLGGAAAALDVLHKLESEGESIDYKDYFEANAKTWCKIETREAALFALKNDPHAPNCLRVNINLTQFDEFYEAYDVTEGDTMYVAPEDRLKVW